MASRKTNALRGASRLVVLDLGRGGRTDAVRAGYFRAPDGIVGVIRGLLCDDGHIAEGVLAWSPVGPPVVV